MVLMKAQHHNERPTETSDTYQTKATLSHKTTWLYQPKMEDIRLVTEFEEDDQPTHGKAAQW